MQLTDTEIGLIRDSHARLVTEVVRIGQAFYKDLFNRIPEARPLFRDDLEGQGMRFMSAIHVIVDNLDDIDRMEAEVDKLAAGHAAMAIRPEWYQQMQEALIDTFAVALGERFSNDMELAWRSAFSQICQRMIQAAEPSV